MHPNKLLLLVLTAGGCFGQTLIHHWGVTGQNLSQGFNGSPALTTTQPFGNLTLTTVSLYPVGTSFTPLLESSNETVQSALGNQLTALSFGQAYAAAVTRYGESNQPYDSIKKGVGTSYSRGQQEFTNAKSAATAAGRPYVISGIAVLHGETDLANSAAAATYAASMVQFQSDHETDAKALTGQSTNVPMLLNQPSSWVAAAGRSTPTTASGGDSTPQGIWQAARDNPYKLFLVGPNYYLPYGSDGLHLTNAGYRQVGEQFGKAASSVTNTGVWYPLAPQSITLSGSTITLVLHVPAPPVVLDTTTLSNSGVGKGFEWFDDSGSPPTITGVAVTAPDTIQITLSSAPTGGNQRLRYAWTGTGLAGTSTGAHGNVRDSDSTIGSSSGALLRNWLITFSEPPGFNWPIPSGTVSAIGNLRQTDATPREIVVRYTSPTPAACTWEVSEFPSYAPLIPDVDTALFSGANSDFRNGPQGRDRTFIIGAAGLGINYAPVSLSGARVSRAAQTNTVHYARVTCGANTATITLSTANIAPGDTRPRSTGPIDPAYIGDTAWPKVPYNTTTGVIDPVSGIYLQRMWMPNAEQVSPQGIYPLAYVYDEAGTWTNVGNLLPVTITDEVGLPSGQHIHVAQSATYYAPISVRQQSDGTTLTRAFSAPAFGEYFVIGGGDYQFNPTDSGAKLITYQTIANDGATARFTGSSNDPIKALYNGGTNGNGPTTGITLYIKGYVDAPSTTLEACMTVNGHSCYGPYIPVPALPVGSLGATVSVGDLNVWTNNVPVPAMVSAWLAPNQPYPGGGAFGLVSGHGNNTGATVKSIFSGGGASFDYHWGPTTHFLYGGIDYKGPVVVTGTELTLPSAPANGTNVSWTALTFGFLVRKSSTGGTVNIDYIGFTPSFYFDQVPNGGSGGSKQCTTTRYHSGWRIGGPQGGTTNAATNTSPIVITTTTDNDLQTGQVVKVRDVPGNLAANGTWTITRLTSRTFSLTGSTGNGVFPSDATEDVYYNGGGVVWALNSPTGHFCYVLGNQGDIQLYWINPDPTPKQIHYLGPGWTAFGRSVSVTGGRFGEDDPELPTQYNTIVNGSGKQEIIKGLYTGHQNAGLFQDLGTNVNVALGDRTPFVTWKWTSLTPPPNTFTDRLQAFDPNIGILPMGLNRIPKPNILTFSATKHIQNSLGWLAAYDVTANAVVGLMNSWSSPNSRYCGIHTPLAWEGADYYVYQTYEQNGVDGGNGATPFKGPYRMAKTSGAISATPGDCATQFSSLSLTNTLAVTGNQCTTISVSTTTPITPATANPPNDTLGLTLQLGDLLRFYDGVNSGGDATYGNPNTDFEIFRVIGISGLNLILQRGQSSGGVTAHVSGGYMHEFCDSSNRGWDYTNAPHGATGTDPYSQNLSGIIIDKALSLGSHVFTRNGLSVVDTNGGAGLVPPFTCPSFGPFSNVYTTRNYPWPNHFLAPTSAYGCVAGEPGFDGIFGRGSGDDLEKHPSPVENLAANPSWFDSRPFEFNTIWDQTVAKVGTYVYKVTGYAGGETFDEKRSVIFVKVGTHTVYDISGPGAMLADTTGDNYKYCLTHIAGECWAGSAVGDVYVNGPYISKVPLGWPYNPDQYRCAPNDASWSVLNDVCVTLQPSYQDTTMQYSADNDPFNTGARRITSSFHALGGFSHIETSPALPDGTVTINQSGTSDGVNNLFLAKIPPYPGRQAGTNRGTWIPVPVKLGSVPAGTASAYIRFGYSPAMYCASRQERCVANGAGIQTGANVYKYETSDAPSGLSCASGCTITIPALSQRMMWYQTIYRNSGGSIIKSGPVEVLATP